MFWKTVGLLILVDLAEVRKRGGRGYMDLILLPINATTV
jgi:hypothetical protein